MHQNTFGGRAPPGFAEGTLNASQPRSRNWVGPTSKGRDISSDRPQDGTSSQKYKAQRERNSQ